MVLFLRCGIIIFWRFEHGDDLERIIKSEFSPSIPSYLAQLRFIILNQVIESKLRKFKLEIVELLKEDKATLKC